ncbi:S8 family serine peptidase [Streptosporangium sp. NPDC000396]|uniref:S8 family peptidase n=1 Tax=Streptosporangium sp. NPDC000396 TaxID=3366185 RepID=UPI00369DB011
MRLRALAALAIMFTIVPVAPALAEGSPSPPPMTAEGTVPAVPGEPPSVPKLEAGLTADEDGARVIVELTAPAEAAPVAGEVGALPGAEVVLQPPDTPFIVVEGTGESLAALAKDPRVVSVRRDRAYSPTSLASGLKLIGADQAQAEGTTGEGRTIAIIDTGIDRGHPSLNGKVVEEACFSAADDGVKSLCPNGRTEQTGAGSADAKTAMCVGGSGNMCDHGTHVAGIAHAVAPGAEIVAIQVFSRVDDCTEDGQACLTAYESSILRALDHVAKLKDTRPGLVSVNLSLGGGLFEGACDGEPGLQEMKGKIEALRAKGIVTVAAAGNEGETGAGAPGCISSAVTVGATGDDDRVPYWSNHGSVLDLFAPGVEIDSAVPGGGTAVYSGTSMSTPHVTAALALLAQKSPDVTPDALIGRLTAAGRPIVYGGVTTPRLDVYGALTGRAPSPPATQEPAPGDGSDPEDPNPDPDPDPSSGPSPAPDPEDSRTDPTPVPLPTVTVTVTVTATPAPAAAAPAVCTRGTSKKTLTAAQWAAEVTRGKGELPDETLGCYLRLAGKASAVFPEITRASTLETAYRVLKPAKKTRKAQLESELLAAWLNWAHGSVGFTSKVNGTTTVRAVLTSAEKQRMKGTSLSPLTSMLRKHVNRRYIA